MFKYCSVAILLLGCAGGQILPPAVREAVGRFFSRLSPEPDNSERYDAIVIGAGSAGSVLANRLTENPDWRVLLLEAGGDEGFITDVPFLAPILHVTRYARLYKSEPRPPDANGHGGYCLSIVDGRCGLMSGKSIGGTSVVNFMIYSRGAPADYDGWEALGNPGWAYADMLPYFIKSERCRLNTSDVRYHGYNGYLDVTTPPYATPLKECFLKAGQELGYDLVDYNSDKLIGFSTVQANLRNGHRLSAAKAFLRPIRGRSNLRLSKNSMVTKIAIDPKTKRAVGVHFVKDHKKYFVSATKEIIVCAGALSSPQLLMLSGIGPRDHLNSLGIDVLEDLPVGLNLQDHLSLSTLTFLVNESVTVTEPRLGSNPKNFMDYMIQGRGPLTLPGGSEALAFVKTRNPNAVWEKKLKFNHTSRNLNIPKNNNERSAALQNVLDANRDAFETYASAKTNKLLSEDDYPDMELVLAASSLAGDISGSFRGLLGLTEEFCKEVFGGYEGADAFTIVPVLLRPKSRGKLSLRSRDPFQQPIIDINYYDDEDDMNTMVRGIKKAIEIASTKAFKRFNATLLPLHFSGCRHVAFNSDAYWVCIARHTSTSIGHYVGTCKMSARKNSGVVDHRLRVHGINGLRVVDASVMPTIIAGHTNAPVYAIAEKASDMIKEDWARTSLRGKTAHNIANVFGTP